MSRPRARRLAAYAAVAGLAATVLATPAPAAPTPGSLSVWGADFAGQLGDGGTTDRHQPGPVTGFTGNAVQVGLGDDFTVALRSDGTVWAWGANTFGQLGDGTTTPHTTPAQVPGLTGIAQISVGYEHVLALTAAGSVYAWGYNQYGQVGDGTTNPRLSPTLLPIADTVTQISAGDYDSLAVYGTSGLVMGWGRGGEGQLGPALMFNVTTPHTVAGVSAMRQVAAGTFGTVALTLAGDVWTWGRALGDPAQTVQPPAVVSGISTVTQVDAGDSDAVALRSDGTVWTWGSNVEGKLGNGTGQPSTVPLAVPGISGAVYVSASLADMAVVLGDGSARGWGDNFFGQIGDGSTTERDTPVAIVGLNSALRIEAGTSNTAAITGPPPPSFTLTLHPASASVIAGQDASTVASTFPYLGSGTVAMSAAPAPPAAYALFTPNSVPLGNGATLDVQTTVATPTGTYPVTVTARLVGGNVTRTAKYTVTVTNQSSCVASTLNLRRPPAIPDGGSLDVQLTMPACLGPIRMLVQPLIIHPRRGDLTIALIAPNGAVYQLKAANPLDTAPNVTQVFPVTVTGVDTTVPTTWTLRVTDVVLGSAGTEIGWAMSM